MSPIDLVRAAIFAAAHLLGNSLGGGILAVSVLVRLALLPLTFKAARRALEHQTRIQALKPKLDALKAKHGQDRTKLAEATLALHREHGIDALPKGTLQLMLVQMPIGAAIYRALGTGLSARTSFAWVTDITRPDAIVATIAAILAGVSAGAAPPSINKVGVAISTLITLYFAWKLTASVGLYWLASNAVSVGQSIVLRFTPEAKAARAAL